MAAEQAAAAKRYNEELHRRFILWKDHSGKSITRIAIMLGRSTAAISQYLNKKYEGDVRELEKDIATLLRREEELEFVRAPRVFCNTEASRLIWEVLEYCDLKQKMGAVVGPSGTGKTETCNEYKRKNRATILITLDIATRNPGAVIRLIAEKSGGVGHRPTISQMLHSTIARLKESRRLLIVDEAHFMTWEALELVRKIHDCAGIGVVYVGQERLYDQMRGNDGKAYLYDQIYSRIAVKRDDFPIKKADVEAIASSLCPGLGKDCIEFLYRKARGRGRFRSMKDVLELALEIRKESGRPMDLALLREADQFLMKD